jgi:hypothetical protein
MSVNRIIPYGYAMKNGRYVVHPRESKVIRRISADYLGGASLLKIAQALTAETVEFLPGRSDWNKNRVGRILEDERYLGNDTYPAIIGEDMHRQARAVKDSNNNQVNKSEVPCRLPCPVECALCGTKMSRRHDSRRKASQDLWTCQNPDCHAVVNLNDDVLLADVTTILNRLIADPSMVTLHSLPAEGPPMEVRRLANEVDRELDSLEVDKDRVKQSIFTLATAKYKNIDNRQVKAHMVRAAFEESEPLSSFTTEIFKRTVTKVRLDADGKTALVLKNGQIIGKEDGHADSDHDRAGGNAAD